MVIVLAVAALTVSVSAAERLTCPQTAFSVEASTTEETEMVCGIIQHALPRLEACHLSVRAPVHIVVSDDLGGVPEACIAYYLCDESEIRIRTIEGVARTIAAESAFAGIDTTIFFESTVVHEMAHALFDQNACDRAKCSENHEYVAHAMQVAWFPPEDQVRVVAAYPAVHPIDPLKLNAFIAALAPDRYAATVWQHFSLPENGCDIVGRLVAGEQSLQLMPR